MIFFTLFIIISTMVTLLMNAHDIKCVKGEVRQKGGNEGTVGKKKLKMREESEDGGGQKKCPAVWSV